VRFTGQRWALADVRLLAPIFSSKVIGVGRNYADHAAEFGNEVPKEPLIFIKPSTSVIGPNDAIRLPPQSKRVEEEAELAVVIGATGARRVDRAGAEKAIFGYTVGNDVTARDLQRSDPQWTRAKGFDSFCPIGPWIVTDLDVSDLEIRCEVGRNPDAMEVRQIGRTKDMVFDVGLRRADPGVLRVARHDAAARRHHPDRYARRGERAHRRRHRVGQHPGHRRAA
jgi:2-keto-4-pentenoate hydratase/2-oxohepta-3-ene-1,7-dioic acid hydratase in catechol pathway